MAELDKIAKEIQQAKNVEAKHSQTSGKKRKSMEDLVDDPQEAERVLGYVMGEKPSSKKYHFTDFQSFKEAFRDAFMVGGGNSNARLWDALSNESDLLLKLYSHTNVQKQVTADAREGRVLGLMQKYKIPRQQADHLYEHTRMAEIEVVQRGELPVSEREVHVIPESISPTAPPSRMRIAQVTKEGGRIYQRSKPEPYEQPQIRYLQNNIGKGIPNFKLTAMFNDLFKTNRTQSSIYSKAYRLSKMPNS